MKTVPFIRKKGLKPLKSCLGLSPGIVLAMLLAMGCAHYPVNQPVQSIDPGGGYRMRNMSTPGNSEEIFMVLTFSGGGTRAAALAYGVLEELARTQVEIEGRRGRLLEQVDLISSVSGNGWRTPGGPLTPYRRLIHNPVMLPLPSSRRPWSDLMREIPPPVSIGWSS